MVTNRPSRESDSEPAAKRRLRAEMNRRRQAISRREADAAGRAVAAWLAGSPALKAASRVALYAALPDELPSRPSFEAVLAAGIPALLPRCGSGRSLSFCRVERWEGLQPGLYGVLEPPLASPAVELGEGDLVLVPGLAFDREGNRVGRGGGYYDATFPPGAPAPFLFGVGYACQLVARVPHRSHDRPMDAIVTEAGIQAVTRQR